MSVTLTVCSYQFLTALDLNLGRNLLHNAAESDYPTELGYAS